MRVACQSPCRQRVKSVQPPHAARAVLTDRYVQAVGGGIGLEEQRRHRYRAHIRATLAPAPVPPVSLSDASEGTPPTVRGARPCPALPWSMHHRWKVVTGRAADACCHGPCPWVCLSPPQGGAGSEQQQQLLGRAVGYSGRYGSDGRFHLAPPPRPAGSTRRQQLALERGWPGITAQPQPQPQPQPPPSAGGRVPSQAWTAAAAPSEGASSGAEAAAGAAGAGAAAEQPVEEPHFYYQQQQQACTDDGGGGLKAAAPLVRAARVSVSEGRRLLLLGQGQGRGGPVTVLGPRTLVWAVGLGSRWLPLAECLRAGREPFIQLQLGGAARGGGRGAAAGQPGGGGGGGADPGPAARDDRG
eukprot:COSAG01_NODE_58_length_30193_cov_12.302020_34_plen_357_part_00